MHILVAVNGLSLLKPDFMILGDTISASFVDDTHVFYFGYLFALFCVGGRD